MLPDYQSLPHPGIQSLSPYIPGKSIEEVAKEHGLTDIIKLASNENPLGCSPLVREAFANLNIQSITTYPTATTHPLRYKLAQRLNVDLNQLILSNGSDALISLLLKCFALHRNKTMLTHEYAFIAYSIYAKSLGIPVITTPLTADWQVDIDAMIAACHENTALIFLASPNNPTGVLVPQTDIKRLLEHIPKTTLLILDEAYYDYVAPHEKLDALSLLAAHSNLVIMRTFSKVYGLAGLRLGYSMAHSEIISILQRVMPPFDINQMALIGANAALDDMAFVKRSVDNNKEQLKVMQQGLSELGFKTVPTSGNFITFDCQTDGKILFQQLQQCGIIVRPLHPYGLSHHIRVTIGTPEQNARFLNQLKELYHGKRSKQPPV